MSATIVFGFLALSNRDRVKTFRAGLSTTTYHCVYKTTIQCTSGIVVLAMLHVYSPFNDVMLPDNMVAFVSTKVCIPMTTLHDPMLLKGICVVAVLGDPTSDNYKSGIPNLPHLMIVGLGSVTSPTRTLVDGTSKAFDVISSDYVWDMKMVSTVCCVFDSARPQWSKTPVPNQNMTIFYVGGLHMELESIALNIGMESRPSVSTSVSPVSKKHKFVAIAPEEGGWIPVEVRKGDEGLPSSPIVSPVNDWCKAASSTTATHQSQKSSCLVTPQNETATKGMAALSAVRGRGKARWS
ncbi:hypothetical protein EV401DRAFT_2130510 [Pisolithus croceorrhizus]|nr:hypothetical protein EV401DRAFT_2130510 [Pisolithus croceorrhizus]